MNFLLSLATSLHMGFEGEYNQIHPHSRLEIDNYAMGLYLNSEKSISSYFSYTLNYHDYFLEAGIVSGYEYTVLPLIRAGKEISSDINFFISPGFEINSSNPNPKVVLGLEFNIRK